MRKDLPIILSDKLIKIWRYDLIELFTRALRNEPITSHLITSNKSDKAVKMVVAITPIQRGSCHDVLQDAVANRLLRFSHEGLLKQTLFYSTEIGRDRSKNIELSLRSGHLIGWSIRSPSAFFNQLEVQTTSGHSAFNCGAVADWSTPACSPSFSSKKCKPINSFGYFSN